MIILLRKAKKMYENILVPLDGSSNSIQAEKEALKLAKKFNSKIILLSVISEANLFLSVGTGPSTGSTAVPLDWQKSARAFAQSILSNGEKKAKNNNVEVKTITEEGPAKKVIADFPKNHKVDLVVIGKSGKDSIDRFLIGSTTSYVVRNSPVEVLVVNDKSS